jgi:PAS domain S-box-containing protein
VEKKKLYTIDDRLFELTDVISSLAALDFDKRATINNDNSSLDVIALALNMLAEEYEETVVSKEDLQLKNQFLNRISGGIAVLDPSSGIIVYCNPGFDKLNGYKKGELVGTSARKLHAPNFSKNTLRTITEILEEQGEWQGELCSRKKDGSIIWCYASVSIYKSDEYGTVWISYQQDISKSKELEFALEKSESLLRRAQKIAKMGHWELNLTTKELNWSDEIFNMFFIDRESFSGNFDFFFESIYHEDRKVVKVAFLSSLKNKTPFDIDHRVLCGPDEIKWVNQKCITSFNEDGLPLISVGTVQDITERKERENEKELLQSKMRSHQQQYRTLFHNSADGIILIEPETGSVVDMNKEMYGMLGYSIDEFNIQEIDSSKFSDFANKIISSFDPETSRNNQLFETSLNRKDGSQVFLEVNISKTMFGDDLPVYMGNVRDATERRRAELVTTIVFNVSKKASESELSMFDFCAYIHTEISKVLKAKEFYIGIQQKDNYLNFPYIYDRFFEGILPHVRHNGDGISEHLLEIGHPLNLSKEELMKISKDKGVNLYGTPPESLIGAPIMSNGKAIALIVCQSYDTKKMYMDADLHLLSIIGSQLGVFLTHKAEEEHKFLLTSLVEHANLGIFNVIGQNVVTWNKGAEVIYGYKAYEIIGKNADILVPPGEQAGIENAKTKYMKGQSILEFEAIRKAKSGEIINTSQNIFPILREGRIVGVSLIVRDITARKRIDLEKELLLEIASKAVQSISLDEFFEFVGVRVQRFLECDEIYVTQINRRTNKLDFIYYLGNQWDRSDLVPKELNNGLFEIVAKRGENLVFQKEELAEFIQENNVDVYGKQPECWHGVPIVVANKIIGTLAVQCFATDSRITKEQREIVEFASLQIGLFINRTRNAQKIKISEKRYRSLFEGMNEGILLTDQQGFVLFTNPQFMRIVGYSENELIGINISELLLNYGDYQNWKSFIEKLEKGVQSSFDLQLTTKNSVIIWVNISSTTSYNNGVFQGVMSIVKDITEQKNSAFRERAVFNIARESNSNLLSLDNLASFIHAEIDNIIDAKNLYIALYDADAKAISFPYAKDQMSKNELSKTYVDRVFADGFTEHILKTEKPLLLMADNIDAFREKHALGIGEASKSWLGVPIMCDGKITGVLAVQSYTNDGAYGPKEVDLLKYVGLQIGGIIENIATTTTIVKQKEQLEVEKSNLQKEHKRSLHYQSMLLSSQLNPHFIFNSLNSIQYYILSEAREPALNYLSKFAKLMRTVLDNSTKHFITLSQEIEFLNIYLDLEVSRQAGKFSYAIRLSDGVAPDDMLIPPMILQPYIENTIVHGVGNLVSGGKIDIYFKRCGNDMCCEISDNGVGREEASSLKLMRTGEHHKSLSTSINSTRLEILNAIEEKKFTSKIADLKDENGKSKGTKVTTIFPLIWEE